MEFNELKERFLKLDTPCVCDACPGIRHLDSTVQPINPDKKFIGTAYTVYTETDIMPLLMALEKAQPGDVLMIDSGGGEKALFGELMTLEAKRKSLAALVTDGACRDSDGIRSTDFPVYSRIFCPYLTSKSKVGKLQVPISVGGAQVAPGDIVFGDADGIVVMTPEQAAETLPKAEKIQAMEEKMFEQIAKGRKFFDCINAVEHYENLQNNKDSELKFIP